MEYWDHLLGTQERAALRLNAVQAAMSGEKKRDVAQRFGITRQTLHNWIARHRRGGTAALVAKPRGRARRSVLEPWQEAQLAEAVMLLSPSTVHARFTRWTKKAVAGFVELRFGVRLKEWQVDSHLRRLGFESHKDVRRAFMLNRHPDAAPRWPDGTAAEAPAPAL